MFWVTRANARVDRVACPWLVKRFIDREAQFLFMPPNQVLATAKALKGKSFDAPGADYGHRGKLCTFEVLVQDLGLAQDAALVKLARIVHAADVEGEMDTAPEGPGLFAFSEGLHASVKDDHRKVQLARPLYDALYAYCGGKDAV